MKPTHTPLRRSWATLCGVAIAGLQLTASAATLTNRYSFTADANDSVGGQHGALSNATIASGQVILGSFAATPSSDPTGQYVDLPDNLLTNYSTITIEAWLTPVHDDFTAGAFWGRVWDFGNANAGAGTHSFWFRGGNSSTPVRGDIFYPGDGNAIEGGLIANGQESHIVWTSDGTSQRARIYVNGVLTGVNDAFDTTPALMGSTTNNWLARSQFGADVYWTGSINEFRVYSGELNPLEVAASQQAGPDALSTGAGAVTNVTISVITPLAVGSAANAVVLVGASGLTNAVDIANSSLTVNYASGNTSVLTVNSRGVVTGVGAGTANVIATFNSISATQSVTVIAVPTTMKHRYSFTSDATDSINGKNGTLWGTATINGGQVQLDGNAGSYVDLPAFLIHPTNIVNKALTFETWATVYPAANHPGGSTWLRIFDFGNTVAGTGGNYIFLAPNANGPARAAVSDTQPGYLSENGFNTGNLFGQTNVHIAVVYNPNPSRASIGIYLNGSFVGSAATTKPLSGIINNFSYLGRSTYGGDNWLAGALDEFRIYDGELDRFQLAASYQSGPNSPNFSVGTFQSIGFNTGGSTLGVDQSRAITAVINFSAATNINLIGDAQLTLSSSDTNVLSITPGGVLTAHRLGSATLTATYNYVVGVTTNTYTANTVVSVVIPPATLVHRYSFNETSGTTVNDSVGTAHGTIVNAGSGTPNTTWTGAGQLTINTNTTLGAQDTYVDLPDGLVSVLPNATFEVWATDFNSGTWARYWDFGSAPGAPNIFLDRESGGEPDRPRFDWAGGNISTPLANAVPDGSLTHLVVVVNDGDNSAKLFINGIQRGTSAAMLPALSSLNDVNNWLGRAQYADPFLNASYEEFRIHSGILTDAEVAQHFAIGPNALIANVPLAHSVSGGNITLSWPTYGAHFNLETTTSLSSPAWGPAGGTLTQVGNNYQITLPIGSGNRFFRLKR